MNKTTVQRIGIALLALLIGFMIFFILSPRSELKKEVLVDSNTTLNSNPDPAAPTQSASSAQASNNDFDSPQWQEWRRRNAEDPKWEWKVPIAFYGRVLDQYNKPVAGAEVTLSWTNLSAEGVSVRKVETGEDGRFALDGVNGKHLLVRSIEKQGYEPATTNRDGFEYAAFFDESFYVPDATNPVIFRMHKEAEAEPLIVVSDKYRVPGDGSITLDLKTGQQGGGDISIRLLENSDPTGTKWKAKVTAPGGLQFANDEFAAVAPESGYESELIIDQDTVQPTGFQSGSLYKGGKFFVKTASGYALVEFRMVPGNKSVYITSHLNPKSGSRNLEFDPEKVVKSP